MYLRIPVMAAHQVVGVASVRCCCDLPTWTAPIRTLLLLVQPKSVSLHLVSGNKRFVDLRACAPPNACIYKSERPGCPSQPHNPRQLTLTLNACEFLKASGHKPCLPQCHSHVHLALTCSTSAAMPQSRIVPAIVEKNDFWRRYFYR